MTRSPAGNFVSVARHFGARQCVIALVGLFLLLAGAGNALAAVPAWAFYYGDQPPWDELQAFDTVVVDPDHVTRPQSVLAPHTRLAAYVSVGEFQPSRPYAKAISKDWLRGENKAWGSRLIDQAQPEWQRFFLDTVFAPLWNNGFRTFFLDNLDSYQQFAKTPQARQSQEDGLVALIGAIKQKYPAAQLIYNRGFEILERTRGKVDAVAAESLFQGFNPVKKTYGEVPEADRQWLLGQLRRVREEFRLPVIVIDYVPSANRPLARETAKRILDLGFVPWVSTGDLSTLGVGTLEVMPRKVAVIHSPVAEEHDLTDLPPVRLLSMPLSYLGYVPEFRDADHLPQYSLAGRYAGVVVWLTGETNAGEQARLRAWLQQQVADKVPVAFIALPSDLLNGPLGTELGLKFANTAPQNLPVEIVRQEAMLGFERAVKPVPDDFFALELAQGEPLLLLRQAGALQVAAALAPWGGYVVGSNGVVTLPGNAGNRWVIDPFAFLHGALQLPDMPVADVTTETGRRMLMVHMDGDGFVSRAELPGFPLAGEVVRDRVVRKYPFPMTISVIEAELSPVGLYPALSPLAEKTAQDIFRADNVAIASHSYSHPFYWNKVGSKEGSDGYNLPVPGYRFDLVREIGGSVRYIEERLAPPGKKVDMFFWTGDCIPGSEALAMSYRAGLLNINGGDTVATRSHPTVTEVEGLGLLHDGGYQVYAPNQNENVYTNNWQGPFYGYERVIETFEFTERPRRLKPVDIYFHTYLTTKKAGLAALDKVFAYAMAQETTPVYVSEYARKVLDFQTLAIARSASGWRVRSGGEVRTLRLPRALGVPDLAASQGVGGYRSGAAESYVHLTGDDVELALTAQAANTPLLVSANARVEYAARSAGAARWNLRAQVPVKFTLANVEGCGVRASGQALQPVRREANLSYYEISDHAARPLEAICRN
jgi:uncharacterized protein (TIGR01370 family)